MVRIAVAGLGKMGISHLSILKAHMDVDVVSVCDTAQYLLDILNKNTGVNVHSDFSRMLDEASPAALVLATPSAHHYEMARTALDRGISVFCEKPLTLAPDQSAELAALAQSREVVHQVGYHYRFTSTFREVKRLIEADAIGQITHVLAEAYGPVVLRPKGSTWRSRRSAGGGCLYDYAAHPVNLLNWYFGMPSHVGGTSIGKVFSRDTDDEVYSTLYYDQPAGLTAQLSVNWCDESQRKMTTKLTLWGTNGRIAADRQEVQAYLREPCGTLPDYQQGWNMRSTTHMAAPVSFYLRGEEYSAQLDHFVAAVAGKRPAGESCFESATQTDRVIAMLLADDSSDRRPDATAAKGVSRIFAKASVPFFSRQA